MSNENEALDRILELLGGYASVGRILKITTSAVHQWRKVPAEHCLALERAAKGQITRYEMRPDIFGPAPDSEAA